MPETTGRADAADEEEISLWRTTIGEVAARWALAAKSRSGPSCSGRDRAPLT